MNAKDFLETVLKKRRKVRRMEESLEENTARAEAVTGLKLAEKVQTSTQTTIDMTLASLEEEKQRLEKAQKELGELLERAKEVINLIRDDETAWQILWHRYIMGETWGAISARMHYSRTSLFLKEREACRLLDERLKMFNFPLLFSKD